MTGWPPRRRWTRCSGPRRARSSRRGRSGWCARRARRRRPQSIRVPHPPIGQDEHRVVLGHAIDDLERLLGPEYEGGLGHPIGLRRSRSEDGGAADLARRVPGVRIDDVVVANAALVEIPLVVAGCGYCRVGQRDARHHLVRIVGVANGNQPGPAHAITDDAAVTTGGDECAGYAARFEDLYAAIDRVALADAAQVDAHARMLEAHGVVLLIEQHVAPVDRRQLLADLRLGRVDVLRVIVEITDARVSDVEGAFGYLRVVGGELDEVEQLLVHLHRSLVRVLIDLRQLTLGLVMAHEVIDAAQFRHHRIDGAVALVQIVGPQLHVAARAHDGFGALHPVGAGGHGAAQPQEGKQRGGSAHHTRGSYYVRAAVPSWRLNGVFSPPCREWWVKTTENSDEAEKKNRRTGAGCRAG